MHWVQTLFWCSRLLSTFPSPSSLPCCFPSHHQATLGSLCSKIFPCISCFLYSMYHVSFFWNELSSYTNNNRPLKPNETVTVFFSRLWPKYNLSRSLAPHNHCPYLCCSTVPSACFRVVWMRASRWQRLCLYIVLSSQQPGKVCCIEQFNKYVSGEWEPLHNTRVENPSLRIQVYIIALDVT